MIRRRRALREGVVDRLDRVPLASEGAEDHSPTVEGDHQRPHDLLGTDRDVHRGREHAPLLEHLLRIGRRLPDRHRVGEGGRLRAAGTASPRGDPRPLRRLRALGRELDRQQPLGVRSAKKDRLVVGRDRGTEGAELVVRLTDHRRGGDGIDPTLIARADAPSVIPTGRFQRHREVAVGKRRQRRIVGDRRHRLGAAGHDLSQNGPLTAQSQQDQRREDRGRPVKQRLPGSGTPHATSCTPSPPGPPTRVEPGRQGIPRLGSIRPEGPGPDLPGSLGNAG